MVFTDWKINVFVIITVLIKIYGIDRKVQEPYMDEIFHIPQTQTFCQGNWTEYHPLITTLPGLYIIPALILSVIPNITCSISCLRVFNIIYVVMLIPIIREIIWSLHNESVVGKLAMIAKKKTDDFNEEITKQCQGQQTSLKESNFDDIIEIIKNHFTMEIILFPLNYFYVFMFYTDIPSTFWLLSSYLCYLKLFQNKQSMHHLNKQIAAFIVGFIAILHRQTNVIWIGFYFLLSIYDIYIVDKYCNIDRTQYVKRNLNMINFINWCWKCKYHIISTLWYYELLFICFLLFVFINGSIVMGDKSHHQYTLHLAQTLYLIGLLLIFTMIPNILKQSLDVIVNRKMNIGKIKQFIKSHVIIIVILFVLFTIFRVKCTVVHEFLLSDNRHYSFYIYRYFLSKTWFIIIIVPITTFGAIYIYYQIMNIPAISKYWCLAFMICNFMVLTPTPLFEFRYFIIPIIIFKLNYLCSDKLMDRFINDCVVDGLECVYKETHKMWTLPLLDFVSNRLPNANVYKWINLIMYVAINIITLYVYITKPFKWADGSIARFMW